MGLFLYLFLVQLDIIGSKAQTAAQGVILVKSPLATYKEICKEFGITDDKSLHNRQKIAWFAEQANQHKMIVNRLIGDLAKARIDRANAKDTISQGAYDKKVNESTNELRQMSDLLDFYMQLEEELQKENPDVAATEADVPESF